MRKPNLFVVGAPKCATTTLHAYLAQHPECFMSMVKEPAYFSRGRVRERIRRTVPYLQSKDAYLELFAAATDNHKIIGESSTSYMRDTAALSELKACCGQPRIIAMLRDPVALVSSYFHFLRYRGWEPLCTLREAWDAQDERCAGRVESVAANRPDSLAYRNVALLGQQVDQLFQLFGRENVLIVVVDDLRKNSFDKCREIQEFLGLTYVADIEMPYSNVARATKTKFLVRLINPESERILLFKNRIKRLFGLRSLGIRRLVDSINSTSIRHSVDLELRSEMRAFFTCDVARLERLLDRNLFELWGWEETEIISGRQRDAMTDSTQ